MNKNTKWMAIAGAIVVAAVIVAVAIHAGRKHNTGGTAGAGNSSDSSSMNMSSGNANTPSASAPTAADAVTIQNFAFGPANVTVKVDATVTWTNKDGTAHTVTADTASADAPASGDVAPGGTYSFTFKKAGTYIYHCAIHPSMQGSVTVTQ